MKRKSIEGREISRHVRLSIPPARGQEEEEEEEEGDSSSKDKHRVLR